MRYVAPSYWRIVLIGISSVGCDQVLCRMSCIDAFASILNWNTASSKVGLLRRSSSMKSIHINSGIVVDHAGFIREDL